MDDNLKERISVAAFFLAQKNYPIDTLCNKYARRQLYIENHFRDAPEDLVINKTAQLYCSEINYDVLCWLIAELDEKIRNKNIDKDLK